MERAPDKRSPSPTHLNRPSQLDAKAPTSKSSNPNLRAQMPNRQKPVLHSLSSLVGSQNAIGQPSRGSPVNADLKPMNKMDKANPRDEKMKYPEMSETSSLNDIYFNIQPAIIT